MDVAVARADEVLEPPAAVSHILCAVLQSYGDEDGQLDTQGLEAYRQ